MPNARMPRHPGLAARRVAVLACFLGALLVAFTPLGRHAGHAQARTAAATTPPTAQFILRGQPDGRDATAGPLDLRVASFGQQDTLLQLRLRTFADWPSRGLATGGPQRLCVTVVPSAEPARGGDVCVVPGGRRVELRFVRAGTAEAAPGEAAAEGEPIAALVGRPDDRTVLASFPPSAIGLPAGAFTWFATARWTDDRVPGCPTTAPCLDRVPDTGAVAAVSDLLVQPTCFGAASRDPELPCRNPALRTVVQPTPSDAAITPNAFCEREADFGPVHPCSFGLPAAPGRPTVLLAGDSHAAHWRAAAEVVAQGRGWHGVSITRSGCPFTIRPVAQSPARNASCKRWALGVGAWLRAHPEVRTVITSSHALEDTPERRDDYRRTWAGLPSSVLRIFVIRDTPAGSGAQPACIERAIAARRPAGVRCADLRSAVLKPDPNAAAARESGQTRVKVIDLTRHFCGATVCLAVVGGGLVRKDQEHLETTFSTSLGPYLLRAINRDGAPQG